MRRSREDTRRTRQQIVEEAARALRAEGVEAMGIGELMGRVGMTHGGFYAHFRSKDALVAEACTRGLDEQRAALLAAAENAPDGEALRTIIRAYLSRRHRDVPAEGCAIPALSTDISREPKEVRHAFTDAVESYAGQLARFAPGDTEEERRDEMLALLAGMAGAIALARAVDDTALSDRILLASRALYQRAFASDGGEEARR
jgi:TetR/AcrR family transcriptional regulator, transcriptional repressor for nem operon